MSRFNYTRRPSRRVAIGSIEIGGDTPIRLQSMTNISTLDTDECVKQTIRIVKEGGDIVRLTTQGVREAENMKNIHNALRLKGYNIPLVADVHFNPQAAYTAAAITDKVRINPGNFADPARVFKQIRYTDSEYNAEKDKIRTALKPFLDICRQHSTAIRLGVNHGSLSDRIMSRYGDTPDGMVESVMEYLQVCQDENFHDIVISIKASNTQIMVDTVRLLVERMKKEGMTYPIHLGVTEAGDGEDGRIKSAVGIGTLLAEGIGDTIRVSLSEDPEHEIPVARLLRDYITSRQRHAKISEPSVITPFPARMHSMSLLNGENKPNTLLLDEYDFFSSEEEWSLIDASTNPLALPQDNKPIILFSNHINAPGEIQSFIERMLESGRHNPVVIRLSYPDSDISAIQVKAGADFGTILLNGYGAAISLDAPAISCNERIRIGLGILQATRLRITHTEYIACPGCGRTLFDLQQTLHRVRESTSHLKGLKIGVMGCIVNGPGEMADADYGYVGAGHGRISLYRRKECVERNIPQEEAIPRLIALIKECGDWVEQKTPKEQNIEDL